MAFLTVDESLQDMLQGVVEPVEFRDARGNVLGHYTPVVSPDLAEMYEKAKRLFDAKELDRIEREERGQGRPLAEIRPLPIVPVTTSRATETPVSTRVLRLIMAIADLRRRKIGRFVPRPAPGPGEGMDSLD